MDIDAKKELWGLEGSELPTQCMFPLEPVAVFVGNEKLASGSEEILCYWCERKVAKEAFAHKKLSILQPDEFKEVEWPALYQALREATCMFQLWADKQVVGVAGTNKMQAR